MNIQKLIFEFIGTFFLTTAVVATGNPLAIGLTLAACVYIGGHISGAHYNPAVSFGMMLAKKLSFSEMIGYWIVQFIGASIAAAVFYQVTGKLSPVTPTASFLGSFTYEVLGTFLLVSVIFAVTSDHLKGNYVYGFAIGLALASAAFFAGPISGGGFNPAVATGINWMFNTYNETGTSLAPSLYVAAPLVGGLLASLVNSARK